MNNPAAKLSREIKLTAELGFDYLELTLEPPQARSDELDAGTVAQQLGDAGLGVVGHTAWFLPLADPYPRVRQAAIDQLRADLDLLAELPCDICTIHPHRGGPLGYSESERLGLLRESVAAVAEHGRQVGVRVLLENLNGFIGDAKRLAKHLFEPLPELGLTLDVAHANLDGRNQVPAFLERLGERLAHLHVSDHNQRDDLHLPIGAGRLALHDAIRLVKAAGYDAGVTLEVFGTAPEFVRMSREVITRWWNET